MKNFTLEEELQKTAELLVEITEKQGIYFAIAFLYDASYDSGRLLELLPILLKLKGSTKKGKIYDITKMPNS